MEYRRDFSWEISRIDHNQTERHLVLLIETENPDFFIEFREFLLCMKGDYWNLECRDQGCRSYFAQTSIGSLWQDHAVSLWRFCWI